MPGRDGKKLTRMFADNIYHGARGNDRVTYIQKFKPHPWQVEPWKDTSQILLLTGSAGGGKSRLAAEKVHGFCLRYPGAQGLILRKVANSLQNSALLLLERLVIGDDPRVNHSINKGRFEYENGSVITYGGMSDAKQREKIRSVGMEGGVDICWMEEATQFEEEDFNEVLGRMRGRAAPWTQIILTTNPDAPGHWINMRLILGGEASVYRSSALDNPSNPDEYIQNLQKLTGVQRQRLLEGLWVVGSGLVFDTWADSYNPKKGTANGGSVTLDAEYIPDGGQVIWAIDDGYSGELDKNTGMYTGRSHPRVILMIQRRPTGQLCVFAEHYAIHTLADKQLTDAIGFAETNGWPMPGIIVRDRAAASIGGVIRNVMGKHARYNQCPVEESIKEMREWLAKDENGFRRCIVHPRCKHLRFEMNSYSYTTEGGAVIKEHDNGPDALRYAIWNEAHGVSGVVDIATIDGPSQEMGVYAPERHVRFGDVDIAW